LEPDELKKMVDGIRNVEKAFGDGIKRCNLSEENTKKVARKSIVARNNLKKGQKLSLDDIAFKRPQIGVKPVYVNLIIGKKLIRDLDKDELITFDLIE
jgi:N,N'-diacetyllegionaminate synthase